MRKEKKRKIRQYIYIIYISYGVHYLSKFYWVNMLIIHVYDRARAELCICVFVASFIPFENRVIGIPDRHYYIYGSCYAVERSICVNNIYERIENDRIHCRNKHIFWVRQLPISSVALEKSNDQFLSTFPSVQQIQQRPIQISKMKFFSYYSLCFWVLVNNVFISTKFL